MRASDFLTESYQPPELSVGDKILKGKFKNSPAEITGFTKDKHNQPVLKTNKGEVQLFKPRVAKLMKEGSSSMFSKVMGHETSPESAKQIQQHGFKKSRTGIFFNVGNQNYSGGGYGGNVIMAKVSGQAAGILDLDDDDNLPDDLDEFADGEEIADYARSKGYWAWTDGVQFAVLDPSHIQVAQQGVTEDEPVRLKLNNNDAAKAFIEKVYAKYPYTMQNNHVMVWGEGDNQQFAMFELTPSFSKRGAVEVKWFQAYPLRQGVGSKAMKELQAMAREDGITLTLFPWDKGQVSQSKLTKFYKGQGFTPAMKGAKNMQWEPK
jgi:hypothetical protein